MKLTWGSVCLLFGLGAVIGPIGDHIHVVTGTTAYDDSWWPVVGDSPLWFPIAVGAATVFLAELRLRSAQVRPGLDVRHGVGAIAAVLATYSLSGILHGASVFSLTVLVVALAALTYAAFGDTPAITCGVLAAIAGPAAEMLATSAGVVHYAGDTDQLLGVAPWLPALYFAFGVTAALLGELAWTAQQRAAAAA